MLRCRSFSMYLIDFLGIILLCVLQAPRVFSVAVPRSNCYAFDNTSHIYDFTSWIGHPFEYDGKDFDTVVRFCKDVESRSQTGYIDFGHFDISNYFVPGSVDVSFIQGFYNGDLNSCETSYDKRGRTAQVNILCGNCLNQACKGELGCICSVTQVSTCRIIIELAIPCEKRGPRIFEGFTVGFNPRSWEVVYNGLTQTGFEKLHHEFSFGTEQTRLFLYMTAVSAVSKLVGKPLIKVMPNNGLEVKLSGSGANGSPPTTLSPTMLIVDWRCEKARDTPYEVNISIPVEGYEPIEFILTKLCRYRQDAEGDATRGWVTFGVLSCIFIVASTVFCCGGFIYKTRFEHQRGLYALPGMTILSACLETVSGGGGYPRVEDVDGNFINQASWERQPTSTQETQRTRERNYGSI
ncbi:hypothetical protein Sjap_016972 [Stephania japonica]|uniref:AT4G36440-like protein n=1 Tax=Stephania japonica TaxID=461633 RepID=A0AAP0I5A5_9MAGN